MRIGFYAPLKAPDHPVPSGDRQMARLLLAALRHAGHEVDLLSRLRCFSPVPDPTGEIAASAHDETGRIGAIWSTRPALRPDLVFSYHLYYKAPDWVGWPLAARFGIPYVTAEASHAGKRASGPWAAAQAAVDAAVRGAILNLCFTANDRAGLGAIVDDATLADLPPFVDIAAAPPIERSTDARTELVTVAMMRPGDKQDSYAFLAASLGRLADLDWRLTIVGDGPARPAVEQCLSGLPSHRVRFLGEIVSTAIPRLLRAADLFVWPGFNEAFGLSYLEAQACGLPVVAIRGAGTPAVIRDGATGLLTPPDTERYALAIRRLVCDQPLRHRLGAAAERFVLDERTLPQAAARLDAALATALSRVPSRTRIAG